jgi:hypothetical protein
MGLGATPSPPANGVHVGLLHPYGVMCAIAVLAAVTLTLTTVAAARWKP